MIPNQIAQMWTRVIESAVADAKRTAAGLPTDIAILARWWIEEHQPRQSDRDEWERSLECACHWLDQDPILLRQRLVTDIDTALRAAYENYVRAVLVFRRAAVLTCAGVPTAIGTDYVLPLVSEADYEHVAGIDYGDTPAAVRALAQMDAAASTARRI